jgi:hypothetical protein
MQGANDMSNFQVMLDTVQVKDGQGASEGDFELRLEVRDDENHSIIWPAPHSSSKVDNNGPALPIKREVGTYSITSGTVSKRIDVDATEVDKGLNGQDDYGSGYVTFDLKDGMTPTTKYTNIKLKRPKEGFEGEISVGLVAKQI